MFLTIFVIKLIIVNRKKTITQQSNISIKPHAEYVCPNCGYVSFRVIECPICGKMLIKKHGGH
jgi:rubrerythrin